MWKSLLVLVILFTLSSCKTYNPEIKLYDKKSEIIWKEFITQKPLVYHLNIPRFNEVETLVAMNSSTLHSDLVDRKIDELTPGCHNCLGSKRLTTPRRVSLIPTGTKLTVVDEYEYYSDHSYINPPSSIHYLIIEDENKNKSEISKLWFKLMMNDTRLSTEKKEIIQHINNFDEQWKISLLFCQSEIGHGSWSNFIKDFQLWDDIKFSLSKTQCENWIILKFNNLDSYLTSIYHYNDWSIYWKWFILDQLN